MEAKRELTSVDLHAVCADLAAYTGAWVDKAYLYGDDLVRLKLRHPEHGRTELLIEVGERKRLNVAPREYVPDAPDRPPNFARMLRNRLANSQLEAVDQHEFDRIATLQFGGKESQVRLVAELFGDGNVAVLDEADTVVDALRTVRLKSRTVAPGSAYEFPDPRLYPFDLDRENFAARLRASDADVVRTLATRLNLGGTYAEEVCARAEVAAEVAIEDVDEAIIDRLHRALEDIGERIHATAFDPVVVTEDDDVVDVTPFPLEIHREREQTSFDSMNEAVATYFNRLGEEDEEASDGASTPDIDEELAKFDRMIEQQQRAIEDFDAQEEEARARAEALYAHYDLVDEIIQTIRAAREEGYDWEAIRERIESGVEAEVPAAQAIEEIGDDGIVRVKLDDVIAPVDPNEGVEHNADRLYKEAKRIAEKREGAEDALEDSREQRAALVERRESEDTPEPDETSEAPEDIDWLARQKIPVRETEEWYERFRWFRTSDGFLVIGGRNADQNEELVSKYMEPVDRFVHAQAHGGPVTLVKATAPDERAREVDFPARTIEEAAQFAVSYSSVWKAGQYAGEAYHVQPEQVSKQPESGEHLQKGGFVVRGERSYLDSVPAQLAIGIACEPYTRVIGGPPEPIHEQAAYVVTVEPGGMAADDVAKRIYRTFREVFTDTSFVRRIASPDQIASFLPPGHSRIRGESEGQSKGT